MSTGPFGCVVLALCVSAFLGGCAVAPAVPDDEHVAAAQGALDDWDDMSGGRDDTLGEGGSSERAGEGDLTDPEPLPWRDDHVLPPDLGQPPDGKSRLQPYTSQDPEPLPWQPTSGTKDVKRSSKLDTDERR